MDPKTCSQALWVHASRTVECRPQQDSDAKQALQRSQLFLAQVDGYGLQQSLPAPPEAPAAAAASAAAAPIGARSGNRGAEGLEGPRLVMRDAVHLFSPGARHHHILATEGTGSHSPGARAHALSSLQGCRLQQSVCPSAGWGSGARMS